VLYTQNVVSEKIKKKLVNLLSSRLLVYENNVQISREIELLNPMIMHSAQTDNLVKNRSNIVNEPRSLYYQGVIVLTNKINFIKKLIKNVEKVKFNNNTVLDYASDGAQVSRNILVYNIFAIVIGFLFSIFFIYLKNLFKKNRMLQIFNKK
ncbi:hypothetical protein N9N37_03405, partial [Candidatus Pelagibacter bacterium]